MKVLKIGKIYTLRNGLKTSPLRLSGNGTNYKFAADVQEPQHKKKSVMTWLKNGKFLTTKKENRYDIIDNI